MSLANKLLARSIGAAALVALAAPAIAGTVVAVSGPSAGQYRVGSQIPNTQRIALRQGDSLTVLDNGGTRVLRGPGTFVLARPSAAATNDAFTALTSQRRAGQARAGAVRGPDDAPVSNPNLWYVDIARSGTVCLGDAGNIRLWRGDTSSSAEYAISAGSNSAVQVTFPEKEMLARWSSDLEAREGVTYSISGGTQVTFRFLGEIPQEPEALALALIENGCTIQLEELISATTEG